METISQTVPQPHSPSATPNNAPYTLPLLGFLGFGIEAFFPGLPYGVLTSTVLIATLVKQNHWSNDHTSFQQNISVSTIGLIISGVAAVLAYTLGLDILGGTEESDKIGWLTYFTWCLSLLAVFGSTWITEQQNKNYSWLKTGVNSFFVLFAKTLLRFRILKDNIPTSKNVQVGAIGVNVIAPVIALLVFMTIYSGINPDFMDSVNRLLGGITWFINTWMQYMVALPFGTLLLGSTLVLLIYSAFGKGSLPKTDPEAKTEDNLTEILNELEAEPTSQETSDKPEFSIETLTPTLILLNGLLLWFHFVDLTSIITSDFSNPVVLSENVHACLTRVIFATVSAIAILLIPTSEQKEASHLRWAKLWIINNGIFSVWAVTKVLIYIALCGFTTKRIAILGLFIGLGFTVKACIKMLEQTDTTRWIINKGIEFQYLALVCSTILVTLIGLLRLF